MKIMFVLAIVFFVISTMVTILGAIVGLGALLEIITTATVMNGLSIMGGGVIAQLLTATLCVIFRPKMEDVGEMMGDALGGMVKGMEKSLDDWDFD